MRIKGINNMKNKILGMMLATTALLCGCAANDGNTLKVKLDLVDFGDTVVVYRTGHEELTFSSTWLTLETRSWYIVLVMKS